MRLHACGEGDQRFERDAVGRPVGRGGEFEPRQIGLILSRAAASAAQSAARPSGEHIAANQSERQTADGKSGPHRSASLRRLPPRFASI